MGTAKDKKGKKKQTNERKKPRTMACVPVMVLLLEEGVEGSWSTNVCPLNGCIASTRYNCGELR